jgi:hypothetical protein
LKESKLDPEVTKDYLLIHACPPVGGILMAFGNFWSYKCELVE